MWIRTVGSIIRDGLRRAIRRPQLLLVVTLVLAPPIGLSTALFAVLNALTLRPLPAPEPNRLVAISVTDARGFPVLVPVTVAAEFAATHSVFEVVCAYTGGGLIDVELDGVPTMKPVELVSGPYFEMLGARALHGRLMSALEADGAERIVVLGNGFWRREFGGDPGAVGRTLTVSGLRLTIIGVAEPNFRGLRTEVLPDVVLPIGLTRELFGQPPPGRPLRANHVIGRLRPGVNLAGATAEHDQLWKRIQGSLAQAPAPVAGARLQVDSMEHGFSSLRQRYEGPLKLLLGLALILLIIGCANLSGILLAVAATRSLEFGTRLALGATRLRLSAVAVVETVFHTTFATACGLPLAWWGAKVLTETAWTGATPATLQLSPDWRVWASLSAVAVLTGVAIALIPIWVSIQPSRLVLPSVRTTPHHARRWPRILVVLQVGLSLVLVMCGVLFTLSLRSLGSVPLGFQSRDVIYARLTPNPGGYGKFDEDPYYRTLIERVIGIPGVEAAGLTRGFPGPLADTRQVTAEDASERSEPAPAIREVISPGFLTTVRIPLLAGRDFTWQDRLGGHPVALVNRALERRLFGSSSAIARKVRLEGAGSDSQVLEIIGVSEDARLKDFRQPPKPTILVPALQQPQFRTPILLVRATHNQAALADGIRRELAATGKERAPFVVSLDEYVARTMVQERLLATLASVFGGAGAVFAFAGVYALLQYGASSRTREIALRMALGGSPGTVIRSVVRDGIMLTAAGVVIGTVLAAAAGTVIRGYLFELSPNNPMLMAAVACGFLVIGALASLAPAVRSAAIEPAISLRAE